jgi:hypothetical protein
MCFLTVKAWIADELDDGPSSSVTGTALGEPALNVVEYRTCLMFPSSSPVKKPGILDLAVMIQMRREE